VTRSTFERLRDVRRLLEAARAVYEERERYVPDLVRTTGLSAAGVELGFASLEREASEEDLASLLGAAGVAQRVHVVLSANVFVAPLRAMAIARAAAPLVTVRASPRDPVLARALVDAAGDPALTLVEERDVSRFEGGEVHVYGRADTIAAVRGQVRPGVEVRAHGPGMGVAMVTARADVREAAERLAADVVAFDQRGCLSPRVAFFEGDELRAEAFAHALHESLSAWETRVPRGALSGEELREASYWRETVAFVGKAHTGATHAVALVPASAELALPPAGRHLLVVPWATLPEAQRALRPLLGFVVTVGSDDPARVSPLVPSHARVTSLGTMQRPPLDGPVDRRRG
jgi:hypothetical protein